MKFNIKSRKGFTLIELLVVIGILAVLAAIAIPSVAGLIDRANVSADKTNSNEMTNALERFTSEYELYCQDIASGTLDPDNLDSAQGRVKNVVGVTTRAGIEDLEIGQGETVADDVVAIYRDTKYPVNATTMKKVVENYTKTSSSTFEPKQSDMHYWYSPDCGLVVVAEPNKTPAELDKYVISGMDAKGNDITSNSVNAQWIDLTLGATLSGENSSEVLDPILNHSNTIPEGGVLYLGIKECPTCHHNFSNTPSSCECGNYSDYSVEKLTAGDTFPTQIENCYTYTYGDFYYTFNVYFDGSSYVEHGHEGWQVNTLSRKKQYGAILESIAGQPVTSMLGTFNSNSVIEVAPKIPNSVIDLGDCFVYCTSLKDISNIVINENVYFSLAFPSCTSLTGTMIINSNNFGDYSYTFDRVDFQSQKLTLAGSSSKLDEIGATGLNYCNECNGYCELGHELVNPN